MQSQSWPGHLSQYSGWLQNDDQGSIPSRGINLSHQNIWTGSEVRMWSWPFTSI